MFFGSFIFFVLSFRFVICFEFIFVYSENIIDIHVFIAYLLKMVPLIEKSTLSPLIFLCIFLKKISFFYIGRKIMVSLLHFIGLFEYL